MKAKTVEMIHQKFQNEMDQAKRKRAEYKLERKLIEKRLKEYKSNLAYCHQMSEKLEVFSKNDTRTVFSFTSRFKDTVRSSLITMVQDHKKDLTQLKKVNNSITQISLEIKGINSLLNEIKPYKAKEN